MRRSSLATLVVLAAIALVGLLAWMLQTRASPGEATTAPVETPRRAENREPSPPSTATENTPEAPPQPPKRDPAKTVLVEGRVLDVLGGPIEGAALSAHDRVERGAIPVALALTDEDGRFEVWITPGRTPEHASLLWLTARAPGYADATKVVSTPARGVEVALFPESLLAGTVETEAGEPVAGVTVELAPPPLSLLPSWPRAVTDQGGRFEIRGLAPGSYRPRVDDGRWFGTLARLDLGFLERREDLRIVVASGHLIRVDVRAPDGSPCKAPRARIVGVDRRHSERDQDGLVRLAAVPPGSHRLVGACEGALEAELAVEVTQDATFTITTRAGQGIAGRVLDERGDPVVGARVSAEPPKVGLAHSVPATHSDARGEFELRGLAPGELLVRASRSDRIDSEPVEVRLEPGDAPPYLELRVERGACVNGRIDGGPELLTVMAVNSRRSLASLRLPEDRRFELCGFEPDGEGQLWLEDPAARTRVPFVHEGTTVEQLELRFAEGQTEALELRVEVAADRSLRVSVDADADALIKLVPQRASAKPPRCVGRPFPIEVVAQGVTSGGTLTLDGLYPGRYRIRAEADGGRACAVVELAADRSEPVDVDLSF